MDKKETLVRFLQFPNGERLVSWHQHDYKAKVWEDKRYSIDGGQDTIYIWATYDNVVKYATEPLETAIEWVRNEFKWTSLLKADGTPRKKPITRKLCNLSDNHLLMLLAWVDNDSFNYKVFETEINFRKKK